MNWLYHPETKRLYRLTRFDKEKGLLFMMSEEDGVEFSDNYDMAKYRKMGYQLLNEEQVRKMGLLKDK